MASMVDNSGTDLSLQKENSCGAVLGHFITYCYYAWYIHFVRAVESGSEETSPLMMRLSEFILRGAYHSGLLWLAKLLATR